MESSVRFSPCNCSVQSSSGRQTTLLDAVPKVGDNVWHDRGYTFTSLGDFAEKQMVFVKGSNDDKKIASSCVIWTFEVPCAVTVYLDFWDDRRHGMSPMYTDAKVWLKASNSGWELTEMRGVAFTPHFGPGRVYRQTFPAGRVEIMGKGVCDTGLFLAFLEDATTFVITLGIDYSEEFDGQAVSATNLAGRRELLLYDEVAESPLSDVLALLATRFEVPLHTLRAILQSGEFIHEAQWMHSVRQLLEES